jgi:hypothetical protein
MKEEDLIKKLENIELPDIKLQSHQRRLRKALLDADYLKKRQGIIILKLAKSKLIGVKDTMIRGLISRQPVWKTATVSILALALVLGLSLTISALTTESVYAQASEIVRNSQEVQTALGGGEVEVVRIDLRDAAGKVIAKGEAGAVLAEVDLNSNMVTGVVTIMVDEQIAIDIAKADPGVKELLDLGATIDEVKTMYVCGEMGNVATGEIDNFSETRVMVEIKGNEKSYTAHIDLAEGKVTRLTETSLDASLTEPQEGFFFTPDGTQLNLEED